MNDDRRVLARKEIAKAKQVMKHFPSSDHDVYCLNNRMRLLNDLMAGNYNGVSLLDSSTDGLGYECNHNRPVFLRETFTGLNPVVDRVIDMLELELISEITRHRIVLEDQRRK
jgi:hypothetical protein